MPLDWHLSIKKELLSHIAWLTAEKESETKWAHEYQSENARLREVVEAGKTMRSFAVSVSQSLRDFAVNSHLPLATGMEFLPLCNNANAAILAFDSALSRVKEKHENG